MMQSFPIDVIVSFFLDEDGEGGIYGYASFQTSRSELVLLMVCFAYEAPWG